MKSTFILPTFIICFLAIFSSNSIAQSPDPKTVDPNIEPLVRIPPVMPRKVKFSGQCEIQYDVRPDGSIHNVVALRCTDRIFESASIKAVEKWKYRQNETGLQKISTRIQFRYFDKKGSPSPLPVLPEVAPENSAPQSRSDKNEQIDPVPKEIPRPDFFKGFGGYEVIEDSIKIAPAGKIKKDNIVLSYKIRPIRTGVLLNDLSFKAGGTQILDSSKQVPAGTLLYASHYGSARDNKTGRTASGLAWCAIRPTEKKPLCIFWDGRSRHLFAKKEIVQASYLEGKKEQSQFYVPTFRGGMIDGGTIPEIEEQEVDFGTDIRIDLIFKRAKDERIKVELHLDDGRKKVWLWERGFSKSQRTYDENGKVQLSMLGYVLEFTKIEGEKKIINFDFKPAPDSSRPSNPFPRN